MNDDDDDRDRAQDADASRALGTFFFIYNFIKSILMFFLTVNLLTTRTTRQWMEETGKGKGNTTKEGSRRVSNAQKNARFILFI